MELRNEKGQLIRLTKPVTRAGGEGQVFEIEGTSAIVAKLYHNPVDPNKAAKLRYQVQSAPAAVRSIAAWPSDVLSDPRDSRQVRGIMMPRMPGKEIHKLYGPGDRSTEFPTAGWDFLIHVAMNCAAAFETLHQHGAVMADVNEGNFLVTEKEGRVGLIDCDSYQIQNGNGRFLCDVGIPMWTPPELQGQNFRGLERTPNHDRFGLAVVIFRLLFMGRHPFAGTPVGKDQFEIQEAIKRCLFAFSPSTWTRGVQQPPFSLSLSSLPEKLRQLFERAFLQGSIQPNARPTGLEWGMALRALLPNVKKGCLDPGHKYWNGLTACPWCAITNAGGPNFFVSVAIHVGTTDWSADFSKFWAVIDRVMQGPLMHDSATVPSIAQPAARPMPLNKPQAPSMAMPVAPAKPVPVSKVVPAQPQLPQKPQLSPPAALPRIQMGQNERTVRLCALGALFFSAFGGFCQSFQIEVAKYGAIWAFVACVVICILNWRRAIIERSGRCQAEINARLEERQRAEAAYAQSLEEYDSKVEILTRQHAADVAKAEAEHQRIWAYHDQGYQIEYNAYLTAKRAYEANRQAYAEAVAQWQFEVEQRKSSELQLRSNLNAAVAKLDTQLKQYQSQIRAAIPPMEAARQRFEKARAEELAEMRALHTKRQELQLRQYLAKQLIRDANIENIGDGRKAALAAYNVCTALDIHSNLQVPGFGDVLLGHLQGWRRTCESRFRYNSSLPLPTSDVNAVKVKFAQTRQMALAEVRGGAAQFEKLEEQTRLATSQIKLEILNLARAHAQAVADKSALY